MDYVIGHYIKYGKIRLLKLVKRLKSKRLSVDKFDFSVVNVTNCKSRGCALGECPSLFPKYWKYDKPTKLTNGIIERGVLLREGGNFDFGGAEDFFGLSAEETRALFNPGDECVVEDKTIGDLLVEATAKQVARNIEQFIKLKDKEIKTFAV